eukprot:gene25656-biopygen1759
MPRDKARASEAKHGSAGGGFPCDTCQQRCTTKANELLEDTFGGKTAASPPLCDCEEDVVAHHCNTCGKSLCNDCDSMVHGKGARKAHVRIPIKEHMSGGGESGKGKALMCPIHKDYPLIFFCKHGSCGTTICALCVAKEHSAHDYVDIADASGTSRQALEKAAARAAIALVAVSDGVTAVNERRKVVENAKKEAHAKAQQFFKTVQASIIARMKVAQADALAEGGRKDDMLSKQEGAMEVAKERLENGLELVHRVQECASEVELLQIQRLLVDGLAAAASHGVDLEPLCGPTVMFVVDAELMALVEKIPTMGAISGSDTNPAACTAEGGGLKEAMVGVEVDFAVTAVDFQGKKRASGGDGVGLTVVLVGGGGGAAGAV